MSTVNLRTLPPGFKYARGRAYTPCVNLNEIMTARFLAAYKNLVRQRHAKSSSLQRDSMQPGERDFRSSSYCKHIRALLLTLQAQRITDPEQFTAWVFEGWLLDGHDRPGLKVKLHGKNCTYNAMPGMGYPSMKYICGNWRDLVAEYRRSCPGGWRPSRYVLLS